MDDRKQNGEEPEVLRSRPGSSAAISAQNEEEEPASFDEIRRTIELHFGGTGSDSNRASNGTFDAGVPRIKNGLLLETGRTFLHYLLGNRDYANGFPSNALEALLKAEPRMILMYYDREVPLPEFIKRRMDNFTGPIITFMAREGLTLLKLCQEAVRYLQLFQYVFSPEEGEYVENDVIAYAMEQSENAGAECIRAAFKLHSGLQREVMPLSVSLLTQLVKLAEPDMLRVPDDEQKDTASPLHQATHYELCLEYPKEQMELVRLLLGKCEESISIPVPTGTPIKFARGPGPASRPKANKLSKAQSVFQWHKATKKHWTELSKAGSNLPVRPHPGAVATPPALVITHPMPAVPPMAPASPRPEPKKRNENLPVQFIAELVNGGRSKEAARDAARDAARNITSTGDAASEPRSNKPATPHILDKGSDISNGVKPGINRSQSGYKMVPRGKPNGLTSEKEGQRQATTKPGRPKPPAAAQPSWISPQDAEARQKAADETSDKILEYLATHFLRSTLGRDRPGAFSSQVPQVEGSTASPRASPPPMTMDEFFGEDKNKYYYDFNLEMRRRYGEITESTILQFFRRYTYYPVLLQVALPPICVVLDGEVGSHQRKSHKHADGQLYFLGWLRERGVRKILKLIVDDMERPHLDEEIEDALTGKCTLGLSPTSRKELELALSAARAQRTSVPSKFFDIEVLDWRRVDLCPETIRRSVPSVRILYLQWSGSNAVLRGWSEPEGLVQLEELQYIHLHYSPALMTSRRLKGNIQEFQNRIIGLRSKEREKRENERLKREEGGNQAPPTEHAFRSGIPPEIKFCSCSGGLGTFDSSGNTDATQASKADEQSWFKYVRGLVELIPELEEMHEAGDHLKRVRVALIDDGVDVFGPTGSLHQRIQPGRSFDQSPDGPCPEHASVSGHGTFLAKSILRICPFADIVPYRLAVTPDPENSIPIPEPKSAAAAIRAAIESGVDIISMSWTINATSPAADQLRNVVHDMARLNKRIPLMFCSAKDEGNNDTKVDTYPGACYPQGIFRIGAATKEGYPWPTVTNPQALHFFFPGVDIKDVWGDFTPTNITANLLTQQGRTGSSIATALAAGLAALLIHCMKIGAWYTQEAKKQKKLGAEETILPSAISSIGTFASMRTALERLSSTMGGLPYTQPAEKFKRATELLKQYEVRGGVGDNVPDSLEPIAVLMRDLHERQ